MTTEWEEKLADRNNINVEVGHWRLGDRNLKMVSHTHLIAELRMSVTFLVVLSQEVESTVRCDGMLL